jgi:hypothetical protein
MTTASLSRLVGESLFQIFLGRLNELVAWRWYEKFASASRSGLKGG